MEYLTKQSWAMRIPRTPSRNPSSCDVGIGADAPLVYQTVHREAGRFENHPPSVIISILRCAFG